MIIIIRLIFDYRSHYKIIQFIGVSVLLPWTLLIGVFVGTLLVFHIILISKGITTNEFFKPIQSNLMDTISINENLNNKGNNSNYDFLSNNCLTKYYNTYNNGININDIIDRTETIECLCPRTTLLLPLYNHTNQSDHNLNLQLIKKLNNTVNKYLDLSSNESDDSSDEEKV